MEHPLHSIRYWLKSKPWQEFELANGMAAVDFELGGGDRSFRTLHLNTKPSAAQDERYNKFNQAMAQDKVIRLQRQQGLSEVEKDEMRMHTEDLSHPSAVVQ